MTDRKMLLNLICESMDDSLCIAHCNHFPCHKVEIIADHLIAHGVTVKEPQKPLTVEEIERIAEEREGNAWPLDDVPPILCAEIKNGRTFWINWGTAVDALVLIEAYGKLQNQDSYNKQWRLWLRKPTEEERKAAEWKK